MFAKIDYKGVFDKIQENGKDVIVKEGSKDVVDTELNKWLGKVSKSFTLKGRKALPIGIAAMIIITTGIFGYVTFKMGEEEDATLEIPEVGDWIITSNIVVENRDIILNGNLIIEEGGSLTFRGVTLKMNCTASGDYKIEVKSDGEFYIYDKSVITRGGGWQGDFHNAKFMFWVRPDANFEMKNSELHLCGWNDNNPGLTIETNNTKFEKNLISNNYNGINLHSSNYNTITFNSFSNNDNDGIYLWDSSNNILTKNSFSNNDNAGIRLWGLSNNNNFRDNIINISSGEYGFYFGEPESYDNNIDTSNLVNGIPVRWYTHKVGITLDGLNISVSGITNVAEIMLYDCQNFTVTNSIANRILLYSSNYNTLTNNKGVISLSISSNNILTTNNGDISISGDYNTLTNNEGGIELTHSLYNTLTDNNCSRTSQGEGYSGALKLSFGSYNTLINNTCNDNTGGMAITAGIYLYKTNNNVLINNTCSSNQEYGIHIQQSNNNIITSNNCSNNDHTGIYLTNSSDNNLSNNICRFNEYHGIKVFYFSFDNVLTNNNCSNNEDGIFLHFLADYNQLINNTCLNNSNGIYIHNGSHNLLTNNTCSNNGAGIYIRGEGGDKLYPSVYNIIVNNTCSNNYNYGIFLLGPLTYSNSIYHNNCSNNNWGIDLYNSRSNVLDSNTCSFNNLNGIQIRGAVDSNDSNVVTNNYIYSNIIFGMNIILSSDNLIHHNTFIDNNPANQLGGEVPVDQDMYLQAFDTGNNSWDDGSEGNHWSDYLGEDGNDDGIGDQPWPIAPIISVDPNFDPLNPDPFKMIAVNYDGYPLMDPVT